MHRLWAKACVSDRDDRLRLTEAIIGRDLTSSSQLTPREARTVIDYLLPQAEAGTIAKSAHDWLARNPATPARHAQPDVPTPRTAGDSEQTTTTEQS
jgi:hypothetical protein